MLHAKGIMPVLRVTDLQRAIDWYTGLLGFALCWRKPNDGGGENCMLQAGAATLMLSTGQHLGDKPCLSGTLYFSIEGVEALYASVKDSVKVAWPLEAMEYGVTEFGVRDSDGYTLAFAQAHTGETSEGGAA
jgi:catechol 2,3-dioxygenase-like lactoylglutathione lyase family enzyme